jgi:hypothetical protein
MPPSLGQSCMILLFYGGEHSDCSILVCDTMQSCRCFQRISQQCDHYLNATV